MEQLLFSLFKGQKAVLIKIENEAKGLINGKSSVLEQKLGGVARRAEAVEICRKSA